MTTSTTSNLQNMGKLTIPRSSFGPDHEDLADLVFDVVAKPYYDEPGSPLLVREPMSGALFELTEPPEVYPAVLEYDNPFPELPGPRTIAIAGLSRLLEVRWALEQEERRRREVSVPDGAPF
jgi:hypothetical protein